LAEFGQTGLLFRLLQQLVGIVVFLVLRLQILLLCQVILDILLGMDLLSLWQLLAWLLPHLRGLDLLLLTLLLHQLGEIGRHGFGHQLLQHQQNHDDAPHVVGHLRWKL